MENKIIEQIRRDYKTTEEWILLYYDRRADYYEESRYIHSTSYSLGSGQRESANNWNVYTSVSFSELEHAERWLLSIELMWESLSEEKRIFVEQRRRAEEKSRYLRKQKKGRVNWALFVQKHHARAMAEKFGNTPEKYWLSEKTIKTWWKEIVEITRLIAQKKGCIF